MAVDCTDEGNALAGRPVKSNRTSRWWHCHLCRMGTAGRCKIQKKDVMGSIREVGTRLDQPRIEAPRCRGSLGPGPGARGGVGTP